MKIIRFKELSNLLGGISRSSIDRWCKNKKFPKKIVLGENSMGWDLESVEKWINENRKMRDRSEKVSKNMKVISD